MPWAELFILDAAVIIAVLIYYRGRPKPRWLRSEIRAVSWLGRILGVIKRARSVF